MVAKKKSTTRTKHKTTVKSHSRSAAVTSTGVYHSFKLAPDFPPFFEARVSRQTFYWSLLLLFIIIMQLIIIAININATLTFDSLQFK
jgi:hypothetical protein